VFDERLKDLIVDEIIVTPGTDAGGNTHVQLNGVMLDGSTAWMSLLVRPGVNVKWGVPFEEDEEGEQEAAEVLAGHGFEVMDLSKLPPSRQERGDT
jgi:hypothetical protein